MIASRLLVVAGVVIVLGASGGFVHQARENSRLRATLVEQRAGESRQLAALRQEVSVQTQRLAAAEGKLTTLMQEAKVATAARPATNATAGPVDAAELLRTVQARAKTLRDEGRLQEALDEYVSAYRQLQARRPGSSECQNLMSAIKSLGRTFPPALTALAGLRDAAMAQFAREPGKRELPFEIALLNDRLGEGHRTLGLYDTLADAPSRQSLAMIAFADFVVARRYQDALLGRPFGRMLGTFDGAGQALASRPDLADQIRQSVIEMAVTNIEVLTGAGKTEEARLLTEKFFAFDSSEAARAALRTRLERIGL